MIRRTVLALPCLIFLVGAGPDARDWAATLRSDAQAFHDEIAANHPGPVNALDPDFAKRNDAALASALKRAGQVNDYPGYRFAMSAYAASFDDGHVAAFPSDMAPPLASQWPGFLTGFDASGAQVVMSRADDASLPLGAKLTECDGRKADALAADNVGTFDGRWFLASRRALRGGRLFVDQGNPFIRRPVRCIFTIDGKPVAVTLDWKAIADGDLVRRLGDTNQRTREPIGAKTLADGTRWFTMSGFDGNPAGEDAKALTPMLAAMRADREALRRAPRIVLDLRGNNGGSSDWSYQVAQILWGEAAVAAISDDSYVEWRASPAILDAMKTYQARSDAAPDTAPRIKAYFAKIVDGLTQAIASNRGLWREPSDPDDAPKDKLVVSPLGVPVYFITDTGCGSACLDAVDLWRAMGAIQVGQETGADTLYMDVRNPALPSGLTRIAVPMKVYRDRPRGSNVPVKPDFPYAGDLRDTRRLAAWIATLPRARQFRLMLRRAMRDPARFDYVDRAITPVEAGDLHLLSDTRSTVYADRRREKAAV
jgi:hypothetical protein